MGGMATNRLAALDRRIHEAKPAAGTRRAAPYSALTMPSVIFLASPKSIIVLSR